ncbi:MAG: efflux RND transporter periplasmic adaptor subunit [Gammaproteobacteria bacterium]|nr:efflux RND transporter periplasmic adaptor subunit [Gammaproteobacteria bacterium]
MNYWRRAWWLSLVIILAGTGGAWLVASERAGSSRHEEEHHDEHGDEQGHEDEHGHEDGGVRKTSISPEAAASAGVRTAEAGPASLVQTVGLTGTVQADPAGLAEVRPRYAGIVREVRASIGQRVRAGDVMAVVESNDSLQTFQVTAPIDGVVLSRNVQVGQVAANEPLFQLVDLSEVWIQLDVFGRNLARVRAGQEVAIETVDGQRVNGVIDWLSPLVAHGSQSIRARVIAQNPEGLLRPGQFVSARAVTDRYDVPLAVLHDALQTLDGDTVAFVRTGHTYEARPLELGRSDHERAEVLEGLRPGEEYVVANSYLIKADLEKSSAAHSH